MNRELGIGDALERTLEAGQSLVVRRIDLLVAESKLFARSGALALVAAGLAVIGWIYLMNGVINGLGTRYPRHAVELAVGVVHLGVAVPLLLRARSTGD